MSLKLKEMIKVNELNYLDYFSKSLDQLLGLYLSNHFGFWKLKTAQVSKNLHET